MESTTKKQDQRPRRRWQNLLYKKCPNCEGALENSGEYLVCQSPHPTEPRRNCFFIRKSRAAEVLLDPNHPANFCLSPQDRETLEATLQDIGLLAKEN